MVFHGVGVPVVPSGSVHALEANYLETGIVFANKIVPGLEVLKKMFMLKSTEHAI